jgi:hypothetical protein
MWSRNEDDSIYRNLYRRLAEEGVPESQSRIGHDQAGKQPTHAMSDQNKLFVLGKSFIHTIEFLAQQLRGIREWVATWITIDSELVTSIDFRIIPQLVDPRRPGGSRILESMNHQHRDQGLA